MVAVTIYAVTFTLSSFHLFVLRRPLLVCTMGQVLIRLQMIASVSGWLGNSTSSANFDAVCRPGMLNICYPPPPHHVFNLCIYWVVNQLPKQSHMFPTHRNASIVGAGGPLRAKNPDIFRMVEFFCNDWAVA